MRKIESRRDMELVIWKDLLSTFKQWRNFKFWASLQDFLNGLLHIADYNLIDNNFMFLIFDLLKNGPPFAWAPLAVAGLAGPAGS